MNASELLRRHDTDKATDHSYGEVYDRLFNESRERITAVLELGVYRGGSLRAWRDFFPNAFITGIDYAVECLFSEDRIETFHAEQTDAAKLKSVIGGKKFDIIIDDASHILSDQLMSLFILYPSLCPGGYYIIEDIQDAGLLENFLAFGCCEVHDLRGVKGRHDDILVVMRKPYEPTGDKAHV